MTSSMPLETRLPDARRARWVRYWDKHSRSYDRQMGWLDRVLFADTRRWVCGQASGQVLEVAVGTGLNLCHYPDGVQLTGIDLSPAMLRIAHQRAAQLGRTVDLRLGDAQALEFPDACFDTVVCTFSLCAIPDHRRALTQMIRVLRPPVVGCCWPTMWSARTRRCGPGSGWPSGSPSRSAANTSGAARSSWSAPRDCQSKATTGSPSGWWSGSPLGNHRPEGR